MLGLKLNHVSKRGHKGYVTGNGLIIEQRNMIMKYITNDLKKIYHNESFYEWSRDWRTWAYKKQKALYPKGTKRSHLKTLQIFFGIYCTFIFISVEPATPWEQVFFL